MKKETSNRGFVDGLVFGISEYMNRIASAVLFLMMLLTMADVFGRKVFSDSILGTVELSEFMLVITVFFALAHTEFTDGHVRVDLVVSRLSARARAFLDMITQFVCFVFSGVFTWASYDYAEKMRAVGEVSQDLWIPKYIFIYLVVLGFAVLSLTLLIKTYVALRKTVKS